MESQECLGETFGYNRPVPGTVKVRARIRKESLTRQFVPKYRDQAETLKKVAASLSGTRDTREKEGDAGLLNWQARTEKGSARHRAFTSDVIPCYRKRGAGEPIFALRKVSLDILFSNVRFNRAALVSRPRASERASEWGATSFRPDSPRARILSIGAPRLDSRPVSGAEREKREGTYFLS